MSDSEGKIRIINHDGQIITIRKDKIRTVDLNGSIITIKPIDESTVDLRTSCNKAVAVARLLGWMKGSTFPKVMVPVANGEAYVDLLRVLNDENALEGMLSYMRDVAGQELAAAKGDPKRGKLKKKQEAVAKIDSLIRNTSMYVSDIDEELAKGEDSALRVDQQASKEESVTHITLRSLDLWAKKKYGISIMDDQELHVSSEGSRAQPVMQEKEEDHDPKDGLSKTVANNLFTSFAFLVEAFAETAPKYGSKDPNISAISKRIAELAATANGGEPMDNQGYESIRKRIKQALNIKKSNLPQR